MRLKEGDDKILDLWGNTSLTRDEIATRCECCRSHVYVVVARGRKLADPRAVSWQKRNSRFPLSLLNRIRTGGLEGSEKTAKQGEHIKKMRKIRHRAIVGQKFKSSTDDLKKIAADAIKAGSPIRILRPGDAWGRNRWSVVDIIGW